MKKKKNALIFLLVLCSCYLLGEQICNTNYGRDSSTFLTQFCCEESCIFCSACYWCWRTADVLRMRVAGAGMLDVGVGSPEDLEDSPAGGQLCQAAVADIDQVGHGVLFFAARNLTNVYTSG